MRLQQPPGVRSCRDGGTWKLAGDGDRASYLKMEIMSLREVMGGSDWQMLFAELEQKMRDAQGGWLTFVTDRPGRRVGDVEQIGVAPNVLELRLSATTGESDGQRRVRLYFSEPVELPGALLALKLASKYPGEMGLREQNEHARIASRRGDEHLDKLP
ncbi:hypothetical protein [Pseudactinotalea sp. HY158]|uniref:hypothetical protein n=1 Tax=Pseudactinotalea sp. HY158 TaxID=2654547 RepID=UPI00129C9FC0|nr:hypothetical protein [Pseudactinotalea sp. HY158]QGH70785.1 hypothetical protein GCE65_15735 [Pseudactinotalea sp. HY158]